MKNKEVKAYLESLSEEQKREVSLLMVHKQLGIASPQTGGGCGTKPSTRPTPNGDWVCQNGQWVWIPDIG